MAASRWIASSGIGNQRPRQLRHRLGGAGLLAVFALGLASSGGCWAPFRSPAIPACTLPDTFRTPHRTAGPPLNFASLSLPPQADYFLGPGDMLEVLVHGLYPGKEIRPVRTQVMADGRIHLPIVGTVDVDGLNLTQAHVAINNAYADGFINEPRTNVYLVAKASVNVLVLGEVGVPGMYALPKGENDVAHALAAAGGLDRESGGEIEVHRRIPQDQLSAGNYGYRHGIEEVPMGTRLNFQDPPPLPSENKLTIKIATTAGTPAVTPLPPTDAEGAKTATGISPAPQPLPPSELAGSPLGTPLMHEPMRIVRIPLHGYPSQPLFTSDIVLQTGDVVVVPSRREDVFYVVGKLSSSNFTRFSLGIEDRDIGAGFLLPRDREVDVVTAVAMAGYIDPIDSPTTVTVHRHFPNGEMMLIHVDLIKARYNPRETILVAAGDIIYLNPDAAWWGRRMFDRIFESLFSISYARALR